MNTSFIGHALLDCYEHLGNEKAFDMTLSIKNFLLNDLNKKIKDKIFCFSYTLVDNDFIHNATQLGASLLNRLKKYSNDQSIESLVLQSLAYTMNCQNVDGSRYYTETKIQKWIDSFHNQIIIFK